MHKTMMLVTVVAGLGAAGAGCGGGAGGSSAKGDDPDRARLAFAQCMRKAGVDVEFAAPGSGPQRMRSSGSSSSPEKLQEATKRCAKQTGGGPKPPTAAEQKEFQDAALRFARCMRDHGVDVPDPKPGQGGVMIAGEPGGVDPASPRFQEAEKACRKLLPGGGPTAGGKSGPAIQRAAP